MKPLGLEHKGGLEWTERIANPVGFRRLFRTHDAESARPLTVNWGYSLDFVPHIVGTKVTWHRTFAPARRDLWYIPANDMPRAHHALGKAEFQASVPPMLSDSLNRAKAFWDYNHDLSALNSILRIAPLMARQPTSGNSGYNARRSALSLAISPLRGLPKDLLKSIKGPVPPDTKTKHSPRLKPGGRLLREWNGKTHVVDITEDGFTWDGESYRSLSAIARTITGTHWSGPRFFLV